MPALFPVDDTLGALFIGMICSSIVYGITWLQVYSYYTSHCSEDRWPLKSFVGYLSYTIRHAKELNDALQVALLMIIDSANVAFVTYTAYHAGVTNFGDYRSNASIPWSFPLSLKFLSNISTPVGSIKPIAVPHTFQQRSPLLTHMGKSFTSLTTFAFGVVFVIYLMGRCLQVRDEAWNTDINQSVAIRYCVPTPGFECVVPNYNCPQKFSITTFSCNVLCDLLITVGMVHALLSNRTEVRRMNNVSNAIVVYAINCGLLNLVIAISCLSLLVKYPDALIYTPSFFIIIRLYASAFMAILNSRENLRETLAGPDNAVITLSQLQAATGSATVQSDVHEASGNTAAQKSLPPMASEISFSESVIVFDREKYAIPPEIEAFRSRSG
ncbi:hypothetical protein B0F90DRAFT_1669411 [Multifurca ochricompacta]|uniref:DUF6534 domain-containing protein n=1 Tax=Multifurca ochricompacta TaxID=376703 RepID=A0AAD4M0Y4_9AGAM|nr:hypothetical protein B0F90DRAFT_1669411 [Multifurca ochricompacta]